MLLNHTTTIPLARTLAELAKAVPVPITLEREQGRVVAVTFRYAGELYRLSPNVEGAWALLNQQKGLPRGKRTYAHAERVAWRCVLSWVKAELALVVMDQAAPRSRPGSGVDGRRLRAWSRYRSALSSIGGSGWNRLRPSQAGF